jgi:hypothetical protein
MKDGQYDAGLRIVAQRVGAENLKVGAAGRESSSAKDGGLRDADSLAALAALHLQFTADDLLDALENLQRNG